MSQLLGCQSNMQMPSWSSKVTQAVQVGLEPNIQGLWSKPLDYMGEDREEEKKS